MEENAAFKVKSVKRQTLNQTVYQNIKQSILDGELPPGCKLSEVQMGRQMGVSATPVREAFRMLAMEGLIRIDPWKGAVVRGFNPQTALETVQCRNARLLSLMGQLNTDLLRERNYSANDEKRKAEIIEEHRAILKAVRERMWRRQ